MGTLEKSGREKTRWRKSCDRGDTGVRRERSICLNDVEPDDENKKLTPVSHRIQTWALEEARRRLEVEGILEDPFPEGEKK